MAKGILDEILDELIDDKFIGWFGEKMTEYELGLVRLFGRKGKVLRNVYLPKDNGETSELDVLFICQKGIIVFESKNYSGWIFGNEKDQYWVASLPNKQKNRFYNPVKQNQTHLKWLKKYIGTDVPLYSIIVFSERCELKNITMESNDILVIKRDLTYAAVKHIWNNNPDALSEQQVTALYEQLKILTDVSEATKQAHVENIHAKYKQLAAESSAVSVPNDDTCPKCGNKLVLRIAKSGPNAGNRFYGCSGFPKCRYVKSI